MGLNILHKRGKTQLGASVSDVLNVSLTFRMKTGIKKITNGTKRRAGLNLQCVEDSLESHLILGDVTQKGKLSVVRPSLSTR